MRKGPARAVSHKASTIELTTYLLHDILDLDLELLLRPQQPLPDLVADHAPLQQGAEGLFARADLNDPRNVFLGAGEQGGAEDGVGHQDLGRFFVVVLVVGEVEEREVDVALGVGGKVGREGEGGGCFVNISREWRAGKGEQGGDGPVFRLR